MVTRSSVKLLIFYHSERRMIMKIKATTMKDIAFAIENFKDIMIDSFGDANINFTLTQDTYDLLMKVNIKNNEVFEYVSIAIEEDGYVRLRINNQQLTYDELRKKVEAAENFIQKLQLQAIYVWFNLFTE